jgi:hypothetical protein
VASEAEARRRSKRFRRYKERVQEEVKKKGGKTGEGK